MFKALLLVESSYSHKCSRWKRSSVDPALVLPSSCKNSYVYTFAELPSHVLTCAEEAADRESCTLWPERAARLLQW